MTTISIRRANVKFRGLSDEPLEPIASNVTITELGLGGSLVGGEHDGLEFWVPMARLRLVVAVAEPPPQTA